MKSPLAPVLFSLCFLISVTAPALAADWPPTLDTKNPLTYSPEGRPIERYTHGPRPEWGYPASSGTDWGYPAPLETGPQQQNHNSFYLLSPEHPRENAPLCVILHSANRTGFDFLASNIYHTIPDGNQKQPEICMTDSPSDYYALYLNSTNAEWWGWSQAYRSPDYARHISVPPPADRRVMDTIEWVVNKYKIDRNRIYLSGVSMGGCGTLGIGIPHGDVFAAILADVPAGTAYVSYRMGGFAPCPAWDTPEPDRIAWMHHAAGVGLPDPPVTVDFSSPMDGWSATQTPLLQAAQAGRLPLVLSWAMFGHTSSANQISKFPICQVALAYPWLEVRKNEAYPVFTRASSDQASPWLNGPAMVDSYGQINAYFRWKNQQDTPGNFAIQLWLAHPAIVPPPAPPAPKNAPPPAPLAPPSMPQNATADVTVRRFQQFKIKPGVTYTWQLSADGKPLASGTATPDSANLLTIPHLMIGTAPEVLSLAAPQ